MHAFCTIVLATQLTIVLCLPPAQGLVLPVFHRQYWLGLKAVQHPTFKWLDPWTKPPSGSTYQHWGAKEPNNLAMNELCGVGNWTLAVSGCVLPVVCANLQQMPRGVASRWLVGAVRWQEGL